MSVTARARPGPSQEAGIPSGSLTHGAGPQAFEPSSTEFPDALTRN